MMKQGQAARDGWIITLSHSWILVSILLSCSFSLAYSQAVTQDQSLQDGMYVYNLFVMSDGLSHDIVVVCFKLGVLGNVRLYNSTLG